MNTEMSDTWGSDADIERLVGPEGVICSCLGSISDSQEDITGKVSRSARFAWFRVGNSLKLVM